MADEEGVSKLPIATPTIGESFVISKSADLSCSFPFLDFATFFSDSSNFSEFPIGKEKTETHNQENEFREEGLLNLASKMTHLKRRWWCLQRRQPWPVIWLISWLMMGSPLQISDQENGFFE